MTLLLAGCLLFLASHLISAVGLRARVTALGGQPAYMGLVTAGSVVAIVMMVQGYQSAGFTGLWSPAAAAYPLAVYVCRSLPS